MQDKEIKDKLSALDVPPPSEAARERAKMFAMQAFNEQQYKKSRNSQGSANSRRPIHATWVALEQTIGRFTMKNTYAIGSVAALSLVLVVTTMHYTTLQQTVIPEAEILNAPPAQTTAEVDQTTAIEAKKEDDAARRVAAAPEAESNVASSTAQQVASPSAATEEREMAKVKEEAYFSGQAASMSADMAVSSPAPGVMHRSIMPYPEPMPPMVEQGRDKFDAHKASGVKLTQQEPVSTFSIDVDTASYSFVRRMLNQGQMPSKDAVRIEEMVNYFNYDYALPESKEQPFKPTVAVYTTPWNAETKLMHIGIKGHDVAPASKPRTNLVFLIDVSGSMRAQDKLPLVKTALKMLMDTLSPEDTIGIVTYAGHSGVALEPTKIADKQKIAAVLDSLGAGGGTAGAAGIEEAYRLAQTHFAKEGVNRVILATDGDFNVGISDQEQLKRVIEEKRKSGVFLSILGFGQGNYNDALMQTLAQNGNGTAAYIDNLNEARKVLVDEAGSTLYTIAKDVKIQVEFNPALISEYRLIGYESRILNREDFNNDKIDAGEVGSGHAVTAIYEITPRGSKSQQVDDLRYGVVKEEVEKPAPTSHGNEYAFLKIRYKLPSENESRLMTTPITQAQDVGNINAAPEDIRFAAAVAGFAQLLKGDVHISGFTYDDVLKLAESARGKDSFGYRAEFLNLVRLAKSVDSGAATQPAPGLPE